MWNPRGLMVRDGQKRAELMEVLREEDPPFVGLSETLLDPTFTDEEVCPPGYVIHRQDREAQPHTRLGKRRRRRGGGVALLVHEGRTLAEVRGHAGEGFEMVCATDVVSSTRYIVLYRRPGPQAEARLLEVVADEIQQAPRALVLGDLNMNMRKPNAQPRALREVLEQHGLRQRVPFVTRPPEGRQKLGSILDHVWSAGECRCSRIAALSQLSDHHAIRIRHAHLPPTQLVKARYVWRRRWDRVQPEAVRAILEEEASSLKEGRPGRREEETALLAQQQRDKAARHRGVGRYAEAALLLAEIPQQQPPRSDPSTVLAIWDRVWERVKRELAPRTRHRIRRSKRPLPWETEQVTSSRRRRNQLYRRLRAEPAAAEAETAYREAKRQAQRAYRNSRRDHIRRHWSQAGKPLNKDHWRFLNDIAGRKETTRPEPDASPDAVNRAFLKKVEDIRAPLASAPQPIIERQGDA
eukprot:gene10926-12834_t